MYNLLFSIYSGHHTILVPPVELESCPSLWIQAISQYRGNKNINVCQLYCFTLYECEK